MENLAASFTALAERWNEPDAQLDTAEFAAAAAGLSDVLGAVGGPAFAFAGVDYGHKTASLREAAARSPAAGTLTALVAADREAGRLRTQGSLARNLWRVLNALRFVRALFVGLLPDESDPAAAAAAAEICMRDVVWRSYEDTMAASHLWTIRQVVSLAMWAVPSRDAFLADLARHTPGGLPAATASARAFVTAADVVIAKLNALYDGPCVDENGA